MKSRKIILATIVAASSLAACAVDSPDASPAARTKNAALIDSSIIVNAYNAMAARIRAALSGLGTPTTVRPTTTTIRPTTTVAATTTSTSTTTSTLAPPGPCTATICRIGDTGPNGGVVFITPSTAGNSSGWYFEARVGRATYNEAFGCGTTPLDTTGSAIGDGPSNTAKILYICGANSLVGRLSSAIALNDADKAWFLPSSGELREMLRNINILKGTTANYGQFWSSTASGNDAMFASSSGDVSARPRNAPFDFAIIAAFKPDLSRVLVTDKPRTYAVGDIGPAGGRVFITPSTPGNSTGKYFEIAPTNWSGTELGERFVINNTQVAWSCPDYLSSSLPGTQTAIGTGRTNTDLMIQKCASYTGVLKFAPREAVNYRGGGRSDWFVPSKDELREVLVNIDKTTPAMSHRSNQGSYSIACAWSSSEADASIAWGGNEFRIANDIYATKKQISTNCVLPARMFDANETFGPKG